MWSYQLFRIGALVVALAGVGHLFGHFAPLDEKLLNGTGFRMRELLYGYKTDMMGVMRSQGDLADGMSLGLSVFLFTLAAIGFLLPVQRKTAIIIATSLAVMVCISITYWFILPTAVLAVGLACFAGSAYMDK